MQWKLGEVHLFCVELQFQQVLDLSKAVSIRLGQSSIQVCCPCLCNGRAFRIAHQESVLDQVKFRGALSTS